MAAASHNTVRALLGGLLGSATDARTVLWLASATAALAAGLAAWRLSAYQTRKAGNPG